MSCKEGSVRRNILTRSEYALAAYIVAFVLSVFLYRVFPPEDVRVVTFFPGVITPRLEGEVHYLPREETREGQVEEFIRHLFLGPKEVTHTPLFTHDTRILSLIVTETTVYLDLSKEAFFSTERLQVSFRQSLEALRKNVFFNFRYIKEMNITIEGQLPYESPFLEELEKEM